jgi:hypothetical protein
MCQAAKWIQDLETLTSRVLLSTTQWMRVRKKNALVDLTCRLS